MIRTHTIVVQWPFQHDRRLLVLDWRRLGAFEQLGQTFDHVVQSRSTLGLLTLNVCRDSLALGKLLRQVIGLLDDFFSDATFGNNLSLRLDFSRLFHLLQCGSRAQ